LIRWAQDESRFKLDRDTFSDQHVKSKPAYWHAAIHYFQRRLFDDDEVSISKLGGQCSAIDRLEKAEAEVGIAKVECANDLARQLSLE